LIQKETTTLKSIMHLKTRNYSMNEIIDKQTLCQNDDSETIKKKKKSTFPKT
jgi:hypothetical protein